MSLDDCFKKGLLRKTNIEEGKIENSVSRAEHFLERAKGNFKNGYFDVIFKLVDSYRASRHSIQYAGGMCSETDADEALDDAEKFLEIVLDSDVLFKS